MIFVASFIEIPCLSFELFSLGIGLVNFETKQKKTFLSEDIKFRFENFKKISIYHSEVK